MQRESNCCIFLHAASRGVVEIREIILEGGSISIPVSMLWTCSSSLHFHHPLDETHLVVVRESIHQDVSPKSVNNESSIERRSYNRHVDRSPQL